MGQSKLSESAEKFELRVAEGVYGVRSIDQVSERW